MDTPRTLIAGSVDEATGAYLLTLDGGEVVETTDLSIASAAADAKRAHRTFTVQLEAGKNGGRAKVIELAVLQEQAIARTTPTATNQGLAKAPEIPRGLVHSAQEFMERLADFGRHYHVLSPAIQISELADGYGANFSLVTIDAAIDDQGIGPVCYRNKQFMKADERALGKIGLLKISSAAGIQWDPQQCRRTDDGRTRNLWRWSYYGTYATHDGSIQPVIGSAELDLRDGSAEIQGWSDSQVKMQRAKGNEIAESKAMNRAIRTLGIRQKYTVEELKKPFLIVRFSFTPDMSDPEIKKAVTLQRLGNVATLYAAPTGPTLAALEAHDDDEPERVHSPARTAAPPAETKKPTVNPFADAAATSDQPTYPTIVDVKREKGVNPNTKRPWSRYDVTFSTGEVCSTFSETIQQLIDDAFAQKTPVRFSTAPVEGHNDKIATLSIVDGRQPVLPGTAEDRY